MELMNELIKFKNQGAWGSSAWKEATEIYLKMLAPVCPHITEEIWQNLGKPYSIHQQKWPSVDEEAARDEEITLVLQINGKVRDRISMPANLDAEAAKAAALANETVQRHLDGREPRQVIYVPGRLVNIVV
jgi:leucyl-tRNA synthetase